MGSVAREMQLGAGPVQERRDGPSLCRSDRTFGCRSRDSTRLESPPEIDPGARDLFLATDVRTGTMIGALRHRHRSMEFRKCPRHGRENTPAEIELHRILDNSSIRKTPPIHRWLVRHPRVHLLHSDYGASSRISVSYGATMAHSPSPVSVGYGLGALLPQPDAPPTRESITGL